MAEFVFKDLIEKKGLTNRFEVSSAATSTEEIWMGHGNPIYPPADEELKKHGIGGTPYTDFTQKRAVQIKRTDYNYYDYLLCADQANVRNTILITGPDKDNKIHLLLEYASRPGSSIFDPWYSGDFTSAYRDIYEGCTGFLRYLEKTDQI